MNRCLRSDDGANAVEFALVLPILVVLVFGIFTVGLAFNLKLVGNHASRDAARFAATLPVRDADDNDVMDQDWFEDVRDRAVEAGEGQFGDISGGAFTGADTGVICVAYHDGGGWLRYQWEESTLTVSGDNNDCFDEELGTSERVQVRLQRDAAYNIVFLPARTLTLTSDAVARFEDRPQPEPTASP